MENELVPWHNLEDNEISWLLRQLAKRKDITEIKKDFDYAFSPKTVSGGVLLELPERFPDLYRESEKLELADIASCWLAHAKLRLDELGNSLREARIPRITDFKRKPVRTTDPNTGEIIEDYEVVEMYDHNFAARAKFIELSQREEFMAKKFFLEKLKLDQDLPELRRSGFRQVVVDAGVFEEGDEVVNRPLLEESNETGRSGEDTTAAD